MTATVVINTPGISSRTEELMDNATIGRAFDNDIQIDDELISRYHAVIERKPDGFWLRDLDSGNGTRVNGSLITSLLLRDGDTILLGGHCKIEFHYVRQEKPARSSIDPNLNQSAIFQSPANPRSTVQSNKSVTARPAISPEPKETVAVLTGTAVVSWPDGHKDNITLGILTTIGRASDNKVCIDDSSISRYHAAIKLESDEFWLEDFDSGNGTTLNGDRVTKPSKLRDGDMIVVGGIGRIEFHSNQPIEESISAPNGRRSITPVFGSISKTAPVGGNKTQVNGIITVKSPGHGSQQFTIVRESTIGRASDNHISLDDPRVSRYHALLEKSKEGCWISDCGSGNGTRLNGEWITQRTKLADGDVISVGGSELAFSYSNPTVLAKSPVPGPNEYSTSAPSSQSQREKRRPPAAEETVVDPRKRAGGTVLQAAPPVRPDPPPPPPPPFEKAPAPPASQFTAQPSTPAQPANANPRLEETVKRLIKVTIVLAGLVAFLMVCLLLVLAFFYFFKVKSAGLNTDRAGTEFTAKAGIDQRPASLASAANAATTRPNNRDKRQ